MDERHLTRPYLESLTTRELTVLADSFGIDIPPGLERIFIIEEILDALTDDEDEPADQETVPLEEAEFLESVPLPKQYNITYIEVIIRDPLWAFAFWEINSHDREMHEKAPDFEGYNLKVSAAGEKSFTIPVGIEDSAWYLGFPPEYSGRKTAGEGWCRVELCVLRGEEAQVLAVSRPFRLPALLAPAEEAPRSPLSVLSGADEVSILRNRDRRSRIPRGPGT
jgi:hypothetical protein